MERRKYTRTDDRKLIRFLCDQLRAGNPDALNPMGNVIWLRAADEEITEHSHLSMGCRVRRYLLNRLKERQFKYFDLSAAEGEYLVTKLHLNESDRGVARIHRKDEAKLSDDDRAYLRGDIESDNDEIRVVDEEDERPTTSNPPRRTSPRKRAVINTRNITPPPSPSSNGASSSSSSPSPSDQHKRKKRRLFTRRQQVLLSEKTAAKGAKVRPVSADGSPPRRPASVLHQDEAPPSAAEPSVPQVVGLSEPIVLVQRATVSPRLVDKVAPVPEQLSPSKAPLPAADDHRAPAPGSSTSSAYSLVVHALIGDLFAGASATREERVRELRKELDEAQISERERLELSHALLFGAYLRRKAELDEEEK